jgi:ribulose-5-phosphate 4-epimerase/fuculose-1-phosphate aldolase
MNRNFDRGARVHQEQARIDLAASHRLAVRFGYHEGICNHFTLTVPDKPEHFLLSPYGLHWSEICASDFLVVAHDRSIISGVGVPEDTAFYIHSPIHRLLPNARCVLHTHMPYATALAMLEDPSLEMALQTAVGFAGNVAYDFDYSGLALGTGEGERLANILGSKAILVLGNHGVIAVGQTVAEAFERLYYFERASQTQVLALSTGRRLRAIPDPMLAKTIHQFAETTLVGGLNRSHTHFAALKRILDRTEPDYAR